MNFIRINLFSEKYKKWEKSPYCKGGLKLFHISSIRHLICLYDMLFNINTSFIQVYKTKMYLILFINTSAILLLH
jgi:hypothetical protein